MTNSGDGSPGSNEFAKSSPKAFSLHEGRIVRLLLARMLVAGGILTSSWRFDATLIHCSFGSNCCPCRGRLGVHRVRSQRKQRIGFNRRWNAFERNRHQRVRRHRHGRIWFNIIWRRSRFHRHGFHRHGFKRDRQRLQRCRLDRIEWVQRIQRNWQRRDSRGIQRGRINRNRFVIGYGSGPGPRERGPGHQGVVRPVAVRRVAVRRVAVRRVAVCPAGSSGSGSSGSGGAGTSGSGAGSSGTGSGGAGAGGTGSSSGGSLKWRYRHPLKTVGKEFVIEFELSPSAKNENKFVFVFILE